MLQVSRSVSKPRGSGSCRREGGRRRGQAEGGEQGDGVEKERKRSRGAASLRDPREHRRKELFQ